MTNSIQFTVSIKDTSVLKTIFEAILKSNSDADEFLEQLEQEQEATINSILPQEFTPDPVLLNESEVDSAGIEYDPAVHSRGKSKLKNGTWKKRRNQTASDAPPPPPVQPENSITYSRFCDEILKHKIDYDPTIKDALERLQFDPLPTLASDEVKLYTLLKELT